MATWTHNQCEACWISAHAILDDAGQVTGVTRLPTRVKTEDGYIGDLTGCCFCGGLTISGIHVRADPATVEFCIG